jgi:hypothetical protein
MEEQSCDGSDDRERPRFVMQGRGSTPSQLPPAELRRQRDRQRRDLRRRQR